MKKVKLPRKRKKAYIKAKSRADYYGLQICIETLHEIGHGNDRFYSYREAKTPNEFKHSKNGSGYVIEKRW